MPLQIDIAFGDAVSPGRGRRTFARCSTSPHLDSAPTRGRPRSPRSSRRWVRLGAANTRLKDFYDVWSLARSFEFEGTRLAAAIDATFRRRRTELHVDTPLALEPDFAARTGPPWLAICRRVEIHDPPLFSNVTYALRKFLMPISHELADGNVPGDGIPRADRRLGALQLVTDCPPFRTARGPADGGSAGRPATVCAGAGSALSPVNVNELGKRQNLYEPHAACLPATPPLNLIARPRTGFFAPRFAPACVDGID